MPAAANRAALYSSATDDWPTPVAFYDRLDAEFGFVLDVCSSTANHKAAGFYALDHPHPDRRDGLAGDWAADADELGGAAWMNPPYGRGIEVWMAKAHAAAKAGVTVVCLVPVRASSGWWHDLVLNTGAEVRYVRGRLTFGAATTTAPFASAVVIYRPTDVAGAPGPVGVMTAKATPAAPSAPADAPSAPVAVPTATPVSSGSVEVAEPAYVAALVQPAPPEPAVRVGAGLRGTAPARTSPDVPNPTHERRIRRPRPAGCGSGAVRRGREGKDRGGGIDLLEAAINTSRIEHLFERVETKSVSKSARGARR